MVSTPGRLRNSQIPKALAASLLATPPCHQLPVFARRILATLCKPVLILAEEINSTWLAQGFAVLYPISRSSTESGSESEPRSPPHTKCNCHFHFENKSCFRLVVRVSRVTKTLGKRRLATEPAQKVWGKIQKWSICPKAKPENSVLNVK